MTNVFISYSRKDKAFVQVLNQALVKSKYDAWVDWESIPLTADWWEEIKAGIEAADTFIFVISPDSVASKVCGQEIDHAAANNKRLVPIVRREGFDAKQVHPAVGKHNWLFFREWDDFDAAFQSLVKALDTDLAYVKAHTRLLLRSLEWEKKQRRDDLLLRGKDLTEAEQWLEVATQFEGEPALTPQQQTYVHKSREVEEANQRLVSAGEKAKRLVRIGAGILAATLGIAAISTIAAYQIRASARRDQQAAKLELSAISALREFETQEVESLVSALETAQGVQRLNQANADDSLPAYNPVIALDNLLREVREKNWFRVHDTYIFGTDISPDGALLSIPATETGDIKVWDMAGNERVTFDGHSDSVSGISFSPDGKTVVSSDSSDARIWDLEGQQLALFDGHDSTVADVQFSPDGETVATASEDGTVKLWTVDGTMIRDIQIRPPSSAAGGASGAQGSTVPLTRVRFSPTGEFLVVGAKDNTARILTLNGEAAGPQIVLEGHENHVMAVAVSPDGQLIATASRDRTGRLWDQNGTLKATLTGHQDLIWDVVFSPDNQRLATASQDGSVKLWNLDGQEVAHLKGHFGGVGSVRFTPDGTTLVSAGDDGAVRFWHVRENRHPTLKGHQGWVEEVKFSPDGRFVVTASGDSTARVWTLAGEPVTTFSEHTAWVNDVAMSTDGLIATSADDRLVKLWNLDGKTISEFRDPDSDVWGLAFSPDGQQLVVGTRSGIVRVLDREGNILQSFKAHNDAIWKIKLSPDGNRIGTSAENGGFRLWSLQGERLSSNLNYQDAGISFAFSPDGQWLATAAAGNVIRLWDPDGELVRDIQGHHGEIRDLAFSPDSRYIASASADRTVQIWNLTGDQIAELRGHSAPIESVNFSPDGKRLVTGSQDQTAKIWRFRTLDELLTAGCEWLDSYLVTYPLKLATLETCHTPERLTRAAEQLRRQGEQAAKAENLGRAVQLLEQAQAWNPDFSYDPQTRSQQFYWIGQGEQLAQQGNVDDARAAMQQGLALAPELPLDVDFRVQQLALPALLETADKALFEEDLEAAVSALKKAEALSPEKISDRLWAKVCKDGALAGEAEAVLWACDRAVAQDSLPGRWRSRRGMARVLAGDPDGAIADFQAYLDWANTTTVFSKAQLADSVERRRAWLAALQAGEDPFTPEKLEELKDGGF